MASLKLAVLISGRGSNLQALIDACAEQDFPAQIACVISNRPDVKGLERAAAAGIETIVIDHKSFPDRTSFERELDNAIRGVRIELICLAGFMRLLTADFVIAWHNRLINIHPSLLPAFRGTQAPRQAIEAGARISGCTVHFVRPEMDNGPIILQAAVPVKQGDTTESLAARILKAEHECYPEAIRLIAGGHVRIEGNRVLFKDSSTTVALWRPET